MTDDRLVMAQQVLGEQRFNDLVGARLSGFGDGSATLEIDVEDRHRQQHGLVHGGVLSYLADNVLTFAAGSVLGPNVVTTGLTVHYLAGARRGTLRATGTVTHHSSRQAVCTVNIEALAPDGTTTLCAIASGTALATPAAAVSSGPPTQDGSADGETVGTGQTVGTEGVVDPAYILIHSENLDVGSPLVEYVRSVDASLDRYGAEILVQNLPARVLEGAWGGFVTLLRFRDRRAAERWYDSPEYRSIRHLRQASSTPTAIVVDGVRPGHRSVDLTAIFELG